MDEFAIEPLYPESAGDEMDSLPEDEYPDTEPAFPDATDYEANPDENTGDDSASFENVESDIDEYPGSDANEDSKSDSVFDEETGNSEPYPEKPDRPVSAPETVSGNSADYPYGSGSDASTHAAYESDVTDTILLVETLERQNDILYAGFMSTLFILGIILGVLVIHGFRLRRV